MVSVIIPAYNEEENIPEAARAAKDSLSAVNAEFEIIFVDDGSTDNSWRVIEKLSSEEKHIRGLRFSRNFGKEGAIFAGLRAAKGQCAVVMDCDLQHPPGLIADMYRLWRDGFEVVEAVKADRGKESAFHKFFAKLFYGMMKSSSDLNLDRASDFKLLDRKAVDALLSMPERMTFFRALSHWIGFKQTFVEFEVQPRKSGKTKFSFGKLFKFAMSNLTSFTNIPMQLITFMGLIFLILAIVLAIITLTHFFTGTAQAGFSTVILLILIIGSFLMLGLGIIGYYISKIYEEIKFRPRYIIEKETDEK